MLIAIELRVFKKKNNNNKMVKVISPVTHMSNFLLEFTFDVFSTVMSPKDVLIEAASRKLEYLGTVKPLILARH